MIQLKHFCNASDWSNDDLEAMQVRAERLLGFAIQIQAQYPNANGTDDLEETVRVISDKVVQEISQETQSSSTVKRRLQEKITWAQNKRGKGVEDFSNKRGVVGIFKSPLTLVMNEKRDKCLVLMLNLKVSKRTRSEASKNKLIIKRVSNNRLSKSK